MFVPPRRTASMYSSGGIPSYGFLEHVAACEVQAAGDKHVEEFRQVDEAPDVGVVVLGLNQVRVRLVGHGSSAPMQDRPVRPDQIRMPSERAAVLVILLVYEADKLDPKR